MSFQKLDLKIKNFHGWQTLVSKQLAIAPYFSSLIRSRIKNKKATNTVITGEPGIGKSYMAIDLARICEGKITESKKDRFKIDQVVYTFQEYMKLINNLDMGKAIVFDEPSYAMGKREWYKELNQALVQTIESQRFLVHPLFLPIINQALLDKTIRSYLIQYRVHVINRGHAIVYKIMPSQQQEKIYNIRVCHLYYRMLDKDKCGLNSCLGCKQIESCMIFRAQYERKKNIIQKKRYKRAEEAAGEKETNEMSTSELEQILLPLALLCKNDHNNKIDAQKLNVLVREEEGIHLSMWKTYNVKKALEMNNPTEFGQ